MEKNTAGKSDLPDTEPVCVVALDAADYRLAREWDCQNILQTTYKEIETFCYSKPWPLTTEVWTSVATGLHPSEHGISNIDEARDWDSTALAVASKATQYLPIGLRKALGRIVRQGGAEQTLDQTDADHVFEAVNGWPGISPASRLNHAWSLMDDVVDGRISDEEFQEQLKIQTAEAIGWLVAKSDCGHRSVGVHIHILDVAGHVYAERPEKLRTVYYWVDDQLGWVRDLCPWLLILSDHGMQTSATGDDQPGKHSDKALVSGSEGINRDLPDSVLDVADWLREEKSDPNERPTSSAEMDAPREHLEELGYLE